MDLVLRCLLLFPLVVVLVRIVNRRQLSSLEPFDLVLLVVIGDLLQQGITQSDYSVTGAAIVITTISLLSLGTAYLNWRITDAAAVDAGRGAGASCSRTGGRSSGI